MSEELPSLLGPCLLEHPEYGLQAVVPLEGGGLAQQVAEWGHMVQLDEALCHFIYQSEPRTNFAYIGWSREVLYCKYLSVSSIIIHNLNFLVC